MAESSSEWTKVGRWVFRASELIAVNTSRTVGRASPEIELLLSGGHSIHLNEAESRVLLTYLRGWDVNDLGARLGMVGDTALDDDAESRPETGSDPTKER